MSIKKEIWNVLLDQFSGLFTSRDSDDIPDGNSPDLLNCRVIGSHFIGATGYEVIGTRNTASGEISSQYTFLRHTGTERMVRVREDGTNGILEWWDDVNEEWYRLLAANLTAATPMGFVEFNTSTTSQMIFANGVENLSVWNGAITRLTATVSGNPSSITVADTTDFSASGSVVYNNTEVTYTSKTATTFVKSTGSFHDSAGADDGVAEAPDDSTHSGLTKGNILHVALDRLLIAGQPGAPTALDGSDEGVAFTFTVGSNRADSFSEEFFNIGGSITGLSSKDDEVIVLGEDGADGFSFVFPTSTTKAPVFREIFRASGQGCLFQKSVFKLNNDVYFVNKNGVQAISDVAASERIINQSITRDILPTLQDFVFTEASTKYFDKEQILLIACRSDVDFSFNDVVVALDFFRDQKGQETFGIVRFDWPVNDWAILDDRLYFGSSAEQNTHEAFKTNQNDGAPRNIKYATKRFNFKTPLQEKNSPYIGVRGFIKDGTDITVKILLNAGFKSELSKIIESTGPYVSQNVLNAIGSFSLGTNPIGSRLAAVGDLKQFLVYLDVGIDASWNDIQLIFNSDSDGGTFLIDYVGFMVDEVGFATRDDISI